MQFSVNHCNVLCRPLSNLIMTASIDFVLMPYSLDVSDRSALPDNAIPVITLLAMDN